MKGHRVRDDSVKAVNDCRAEMTHDLQNGGDEYVLNVFSMRYLSQEHWTNGQSAVTVGQRIV